MKRISNYGLFILFSLLPLTYLSCSKDAEIPILPPQDKMTWWDEAKFGMFIHFGVYAVPAGQFVGTNLDGTKYTSSAPNLCQGIGAEWIMNTSRIPRTTYKLYAKDFNCKNFDAEKIVQLAKSVGMRYIVITLKHHDGFVMYPTQLTDWNITNSAANGLDVIKEMQDACVRNQLRFGVYFSQNVDWMTDGSYGEVPEINGSYEDHTQYNSYTESLIKEFVKRYPHIDLIWWDGYFANYNEDYANIFKNAALSIKPDMIFNDRLYAKHEGDYITPEGHLNLPVQKFKRFELCNSVCTGSWGYSESKYQQSFMSKNEIVVNLLRCLQYGGNMLLNVSPKADGSIPQSQITPLEEAGSIIQRMGGIQKSHSLKQVYGQHNCICRYTVENGNTKLYVTRLPNITNSEIQVTGIKNKIINVTTQHTAQKEDNTIIINGFNGNFDTACILLSGDMDSYDAGINLPCQDIISPLSAYANGELSLSIGDENQFMYRNWNGDSFGSIEYMFNSHEDKSYKISIFTAEASGFEVTIDIDGVKYTKNIKVGYQRHKSTILDDCNLSKGNHIIKLTITSPRENWSTFYGIAVE